MVAALFVEKDGCYFGLPNVDPWDIDRDARQYAGPHPVIAHPPCQRWGRFWHGSTRKPHQFKLGDDGGCFEAALWAVDWFGGVLEHPADSHAWDAFKLVKPPRDGGWVRSGSGWTCCVYQGHYGHMAGKATWLYARTQGKPPELRWGKCEQRIHPIALAKHGYAKARRIGMMAMVGGKDKTKIRNATPPEFRDVLLSIVTGSVLSIRLNDTTKETDMAWNVPGRCDTELAAAEFLRSPALHKIKIEEDWYTREQITDKLMEWAGARIGAAAPTKGPSPEYRALLDASDVRDA